MEKIAENYLKQNQNLKIRALDRPRELEKFATEPSKKLYWEWHGKAKEFNRAVDKLQTDVAAIIGGTVPPTGAVEFASRLKVRRIELATQLVELVKEKQSITAILTKEFDELYRKPMHQKYEAKKAESTKNILKQFPNATEYSTLCRDAIAEECREAGQDSLWQPSFLSIGQTIKPEHELSVAKYQLCQSMLRATGCDDLAQWPEFVEV